MLYQSVSRQVQDNKSNKITISCKSAGIYVQVRPLWTVLQRRLNISDVSLSEYFAVDSSVSTEEVQSAEEICKDQEGNADDGSDSSDSDSCVDENADDPPSRADATDALRTVQRYLQSLPEVPSVVFT